jgi:hypothetical protein
MRQFAVLWLAFFCGLAAWQLTLERPWQASHLAALGLGGGLTGLIKPALLRPIYTGWMVLVFPLNWAVSHLLLGLLFFGMITPLAIAFRLVGRDALQRRRMLHCASYWQGKATVTNVRSYYRPF